MANDVREVKDWLIGVERDPDAYVVVAPFGFKKVELDGKHYLQSQTKEEAIANLRESSDPRHNELADQLEAGLLDPPCISTSGGYPCLALSGCHSKVCHPERAGGGGWNCYCV